MQPRRVLLARLFHESHSFNPRPTTREHFRIDHGTALLEGLRDSNSVLAGLAARFKGLGYEILPGVSAVAPPGGLVEHAFYLSIKEALLERAAAGDFDALALELHGAMATGVLADVEGDLLSDLRSVVGSDIPIGVGLDLHGNMTPAMLRAADVAIACKENPHSDLFACGTRVADSIDAVLDGRLRPVTCLVKVPMILTGNAETGHGPLAELHRRARLAVAADPRLWDVSIFNVYPFADDADMGQAVLAVADHDPAPAIAVAETIGDLLWQWRDRFVDDFPDVDSALDMVARERDRRPFALADMGDRVLAGAPGDSNAILGAVLARGDGLKGAVPITDPESAAAARAAGIGAVLTLAVGGKLTPGFDPIELTGEVISLSDGRFTCRGPYQAGESACLGPTAVIKAGRLSVILTTLPAFTQDPNAFESQGVAIASQDFLVVKSGYHFKISFEGIATPLMTESPGLSRYRPGFFHWDRGRVHPAYSVCYRRARPSLFDRRRMS
ncbi:MAG: M81 family metallopeptidase [Kiloniellales bacterium]